MQGVAKLDYLKRYVTTKKTKTDQKAKNQLKVIDYEIDDPEIRHSGDEDDDEPLIVDSVDSFKLTKEQRDDLIRKGKLKSGKGQAKDNLQKSKSGVWVTVEEDKGENKEFENEISYHKEKAASSDSSDGEDSVKGNKGARRRHDSDSEDDDDAKDGEIDGGDRRAKKELEKFEKMKQKMGKALGMPAIGDNSRGLKVDKDGDLSPLRNNLSQHENLGNKPILEIKLQNKKGKEKEEKKLAEQFKGAQTIYRDKEGRKIDILQDIETKKQELTRKNQERIKEWGAGIVQKKEAESRMKELQAMKTEGFAQYNLSKEQDINLMEVQRFGDPMNRIIKSEENKVETKKKTKSLLRCKFPGIPNRSGIAPGYRWDGVDRSNGYEKRLLQSVNTEKAKQSDANVWSMRDL